MKRNQKQPKRLREREGRALSKYAEKGGAYKYQLSSDHVPTSTEQRGPHPRGVHRGSGARPFKAGRGNVR